MFVGYQAICESILWDGWLKHKHHYKHRCFKVLKIKALWYCWPCPIETRQIFRIEIRSGKPWRLEKKTHQIHQSHGFHGFLVLAKHGRPLGGPIEGSCRTASSQGKENPAVVKAALQPWAPDNSSWWVLWRLKDHDLPVFLKNKPFRFLCENGLRFYQWMYLRSIEISV